MCDVVQHVVRSIVPSVNDNGFSRDETEEQQPTHADAAQSPDSADKTPAAPRRRRGGRRVVRGAGAAGAAVALKVEDHSAPLFAEPVVEQHLPRRRRSKAADESPEANEPETAASADSEKKDDARHAKADGKSRSASRSSKATKRHDDDADQAEPRRTRVRRRTAMFSSREDASPAVPGEPSDDDLGVDTGTDIIVRDDSADLSRALDVVSTLPQPAPRAHAMTSVLFQEPVLPVPEIVRDARDDDREDDDRDSRGGGKSRRSRNGRVSRDGAQGDKDKSASSRRDIDGLSHIERVDSFDTDDSRSRDESGEADEPVRSSRRNRRLNAQERRAAAEVEQIEEDLELDGISYTPVDDEEPSEDSGTRSRRRRRSRQNRADDSRGNGESDSSQSAAQQDEPAKPSSRRTRDEEEDDDSNVTRRRRRRRSRASDEQGDDEMTVRRSRKQQYIDEITDVEGSTRLEAKKQRRRDNRRERSRQSQLVEQDFLARREHVNRLMVVRERGHHTQISVIEDNVLVEHYVSDIQEVATVGNIYLGRVQNVLPSMEAAFVDIGQSRNGVLYAGEVNWDATRLEGQPRRIELAFKSGDPVLVQVTKDPIGHKGARLTSQVTLAGRFLVLVPSGGMTGVSRKLSERERSRLKGIVSKIAPKDMGVIIRTAAEGAKEEAIVKDLESLVRQWERINAKREEFWHGKRPKLLQGEPDVAIRVVRDIFNDNFGELIVEGDKVYERIEEYLDTMAPDLKEKLSKWDPSEHQGKDVFDKWQIDAQLRKGMERQVYLPSGGSIVIDRTEAMTTIDVNTGRFIGRGKSLEETVTRCNLEAAEEIARQLRLRDIGGMVMIDFVDMVMPANRDLVLRRLVECLARDRTKHQVAEVTSLGLVQMTRKRIGQGLVEAFSEECPTCHGRGFILHDEPTVSADYDDPYALKGGDPFIKTNKHGRGTDVQVPQGSSPDIKAKLAQIAAAAVAANGTDEDE